MYLEPSLCQVVGVKTCSYTNNVFEKYFFFIASPNLEIRKLRFLMVKYLHLVTEGQKWSQI